MRIFTNDELNVAYSFQKNLYKTQQLSVNQQGNDKKASSSNDAYQAALLRDIPRITSDLRSYLNEVKEGRMSQEEFNGVLSEYTKQYVKDEMPADKKIRIINAIQTFSKYVNNIDAKQKSSAGVNSAKTAEEHQKAQVMINAWSNGFAKSQGVELEAGSNNFTWSELMMNANAGNPQYTRQSERRGFMVDMQL